MSSELTYQQNMVWDRLHDGLKSIEQANESLESKAGKILAGSASFVSALGILKMLPNIAGTISLVDGVAMLLLCVLTAVMCWFGSRMWCPSPMHFPGDSDTDALYEEYLAKEKDVAFNNALIDSASAFEIAVSANKEKSRNVWHMVTVLQVQIVVLGVFVVAKAFGL